jgi:hypothetical protein
MTQRLLSIYLQDHLAGATLGVALARCAARSHANTHGGPVLTQVAGDIEADRETLKRLMADLGVRPSRSKDAAAWLGERLARLKPSGRLSRGRAYHELHELETLSLGIAGKLGLWEALRIAEATDLRFNLDQLEERARSQRQQVEELRAALARVALSS